MGINIEMTGSGELGPLAPGWSVQEYATPVTIGETAGGTGNVTFNAAAREDSLFVVNNNITTTEETLGSISGVVKSVSQTGLNVSVTHDTPLAIFDATKNIPALGAGGIYSALDLCNQLSGRQNLIKDYVEIVDDVEVVTPRTGRFYSLGGHSAGFNRNSELIEAETTNGTYTDYNPNDGKFYLNYFRQQYGVIWASTFNVINNKLWATKVSGDAFSNSQGARTSRLAFKTLLDGGNVSWGFSGLPDDSNTSTGQTIGFSIDYASNTFSIGGDYRDGGILSSFAQTYDMGTLLDKDEELAVFIEYTIPTPGDVVSFTYKVTVCNTSDYSVTGELVQILDNTALSIFNSSWGMTGNVRSIYREQGNDLGNWIAEYEIDETYSITGDIVVDGPVAAQNGANMWEYLQQACSAYGYELSVVNDVIIVRTIGSNVISIDNSTVPTVSPNMTLTGRNIEVGFTNAASIVDVEIYNALNDNNRVLSVKADEQITTTLEISGTPAIVNLPTPSKSARAGVGEYALCESDGGPIPYNLWSDAGGRVDVMINPDNPNAIDVVLTGPSSSWVAPGGGTPFGGTTPLYAGPYKVAYSSGGTDYAALSITATGVKTKPQVLKIRTAADDLKVAQDIAKSISNPFIATKQMAYDRGEWAIVEASGPKVTISGSIPVSAVAGFGLVAGSLIHYRDSIYRVTDATIGNLVVNFTASRHVTVDDFDTLWNGKTVGSHDLMWQGYDTADQVIAPLRYIGDDESVLMFLDTDVNPYYDFNGEPEISVFPDTDMNPYYEEGGNLEGEDPVYLDVDENPYDGGDGYGS